METEHPVGAAYAQSPAEKSEQLQRFADSRNAISQTLAERGARYGDFSDHAVHAQALQDAMRAMPNWPSLSPDKKQALTVIADKIARIGTGDPEYDDNWHDIQGYAKLAEDRCAPVSQTSFDDIGDLVGDRDDG